MDAKADIKKDAKCQLFSALAFCLAIFSSYLAFLTGSLSCSSFLFLSRASTPAARPSAPPRHPPVVGGDALVRHPRRLQRVVKKRLRRARKVP